MHGSSSGNKRADFHFGRSDAAYKSAAHISAYSNQIGWQLELLRGSHNVTQIDFDPTIQLEPKFRRLKLRRWRFEKSIIGRKLLGLLSGRPDVTRRQTTIELNRIRRAYQSASPTKRQQLRKLAMQISARFEIDKPAETPSLIAPGAKKETRSNWRPPSLREEN